MYQTRHQQLFRLAILLTGDEITAESVVTDAFVALHRAWKAVGSAERAWRYLLRVAIARSRRATRGSAGLQRPAVMTACATGASQTRGNGPTMMVTLRAMPQHQREAIALTYYLGLSEDEAAAAMGVRKAALQRLTAQARRALSQPSP